MLLPDTMFESYKNKILSFYREHKRMPAYAEIMTLVGFRSKNAVYKLINKMVEAGIVEKDSSGKIVPRKIFGEVPILGLVEAGFPTEAEESHADSVSLDDYLIENKEATYLLEVKGDSMIDAGIQEGDLVIAERINREPKVGEIVIAEVDGGWTMKYFRRRGNQVYLEPANRNYDLIYPENDLQVAAVVKGVVRKY